MTVSLGHHNQLFPQHCQNQEPSLEKLVSEGEGIKVIDEIKSLLTSSLDALVLPLLDFVLVEKFKISCCHNSKYPYTLKIQTGMSCSYQVKTHSHSGF